MKYEIVIEKSAVKFLSKLEKRTRAEIVKAIDKLGDEPRPFGYKKLLMQKVFTQSKADNIELLFCSR